VLSSQLIGKPTAEAARRRRRCGIRLHADRGALCISGYYDTKMQRAVQGSNVTPASR
jgi:hypothetical protein